MTREQQLEALASDLDHAVRTLLVAVERAAGVSEFDNEAYMRTVAIPRARAATAAYKLFAASPVEVPFRFMNCTNTKQLDPLEYCPVCTGTGWHYQLQNPRWGK